MRETPVSDLIQLAGELRLQGQSRPVRFSPRLGNHFTHQFEAHSIPVNTGLTADENSAFGGLKPASKDEFHAFVRRHFSQHANRIRSLYLGDNKDYTIALSQLRSDAGLAAMHLRLQQQDAPQTSFVYLFNAEPTSEPESYRSFHSGELPYMSANLTVGNRHYADNVRKLSDTMLRYWLAFISSSEIDNSVLDWPVYSDKQQTMHFGDKSGAELRRLLPEEKLELFSQIHNGGGRLSIIMM